MGSKMRALHLGKSVERRLLHEGCRRPGLPVSQDRILVEQACAFLSALRDCGAIRSHLCLSCLKLCLSTAPRSHDKLSEALCSFLATLRLGSRKLLGRGDLLDEPALGETSRLGTSGGLKPCHGQGVVPTPRLQPRKMSHLEAMR